MNFACPFYQQPSFFYQVMAFISICSFMHQPAPLRNC
uniref:Uncharacterized protein n=1 Tax=Arundo donax TaxID=35708 RepID=A0A0A8ZYK7_ARUDO